ncbi:MAG: TetR family transcriptional regulator [Verrucomicrobiales bacterium]|nr:TetR family transcriptional regulator [Verrucomicrobiales bacterium]
MERPGADSKNWKRARKPEQIQVRQEAILTAAKQLLDEGGADAAGLSAIARAAGLSKANLYRYFESREAILLTIFISELEQWSLDLGAALTEIPEPGDVTSVAQLYTDSISDRTRLNELMSVFAPVLERNLTVESVAVEKSELRSCFVRLIPALCSALPQLSKAKANEFLIMQTIFQMGLWPHANPSPEVDEVLRQDAFADLRMNFEERVRWHALILLRGLETVDAPRVRPT